jgi:hypothetical protein
VDNPFNFSGLEVLKFPEQKQDQQHDQNHPAKAHSRVAEAITIAAEAAAPPAKQIEDHDNDKYRS